MDQKKLSALFRTLGARDPGAWAQSQIEEGVPQLARFLFLRQSVAGRRRRERFDLDRERNRARESHTGRAIRGCRWRRPMRILRAVARSVNVFEFSVYAHSAFGRPCRQCDCTACNSPCAPESLSTLA